MTLVVLLPGARVRPRSGPATILSFTSSKEEEEFRSVGNPGDCWVSIGSILKSATERARAKYVKFTAQWPHHAAVGIHRRFTEQGRLGLWWLSSASMKDNEGRRPVFRQLTQFEIFRMVLDPQQQSACIVLGGNYGLVDMMRQHCESKGVTFAAHGTRRERRRPLLFSVAAHVRLALRAALWRLSHTRKTSPTLRRGAVGFFSVLPESFAVDDDRYRDRNYGTLLERVAERGLPSFSVVHESSWAFSLRSAARDLQDRPPASLPVHLLSTYLRGRDFLYALGCIRHSFRYWVLDTFDSRFRSSFLFDGIDARKLIGTEYRERFLGAEIASNLLVMRAAERFAHAMKPCVVVSFLELYPIGRALYEGIKRGSPSTATVAYQHASLSSGKLWYCYEPSELRGSGAARMPTPDRFLLAGPLAQRVVVRSGFPVEAALVLGSPRYDDLADFARDDDAASGAARESLIAGGERVVLVAPSLDRGDAEDLLRTVAAALGDREGWTLVVRPHPLQPIDDCVSRLASRAHAQIVAARDKPLHELIRASDVVIVSYSTVGEESVALGKPVVCYAGRGPTMSALAEFEEIPLVTDPEELTAAVDELLDHPERVIAMREAVVSGCFFQLDGHATERAADALAAIAEERR